MRLTTMYRGTGLLCVSLFVLRAAQAVACDIPVFKYALDNWEPALYRVTVYHQGNLAPQQQVFVDMLQKSAASGLANVAVDSVDLAAKPDPSADILRRDVPPNEPFVAIRSTEMGKGNIPAAAGMPRPPQAPLPAGEEGAVVAVFPLRPEWVVGLLDSPVRRELARRLIGGDAIVWLLVECGDKTLDDRYGEILKTEIPRLEAMANKVEEPRDPVTGSTVPAGRPGMPNEPAKPPVKVAFSMLRMSATDGNEKVLVEQLKRVKSLPADNKGPVLYPVFGRGRVLDAIRAADITPDMLGNIAAFLCGDCSCQIKAMNPGSDLIMTADWTSAKQDSRRPIQELPSLAAVIPAVPPAAPPPPVAPPAIVKSAAPAVTNVVVPAAQKPVPPPAEPTASSAKRNLLVTIGILLALIVVVSVGIMKKSDATGNRP